MAGRHPHGDEIFFAALDVPVEERAEFLRVRCGEDQALLAEVESLLRSYERAGDFLETPVTDQDVIHTPDSGDLSGSRVGEYEILRLLGAGGMSTVYLAERRDGDFRMQVALKVIRGGLNADEILRRFQTERQVLASLEHPNIARLIDARGAAGGRLYLVMEYVEGIPLHTYCDEQNLPVAERLRLFRELCDAVQYAHRNLVVHRDLKPSNVLVNTEGQVKLLDFGISKVLEADAPAVTTLTGFHAMTPQYASPEQVRGERVATSSDVYSLGVILYELLTGCPPYRIDSSSPSALIKSISEEIPTKPSLRVRERRPDGADSGRRSGDRASDRRLARRLAGDLDNIVLKALRKEPDRRYGSVEQLSDDVRRFLEGLPVSARPDTIRYRTAKFVRRNVPALAALAGLIVTLLGGVVVSVTLLVRANQAQFEAETQRATAEEISAFLQNMLNSLEPGNARGRDVTVFRELLEAAERRIDVELGDQPEVAAALHLTMGNAYRGIADYEDARRHYNKSIDLRQQLYGREDLRLAESLYHLGRLLKTLGEYPAADSLLQASMAIQESLGRADHPDFARALYKRAEVLDAVNESEACETTLREAIGIQRRASADGGSELALSLTYLGHFLLHHDRVDEAEPPLREALEIRRRFGTQNPLGVADALTVLAQWLRSKDRLDEAASCLEESVAIHEEFFEDDHPGRTTALGELATVHELRGDFAQAESIYRDVIEVMVRVYGEIHRDVGTSHNDFAGMLWRAGRYEEAVVHHEKAVEIYRAALGPEHVWVAIALANLARTHESRGDHREAERICRETLRVGLRVWSPEHWRNATVRSILGASIAGQGAAVEAESLLVGSYADLNEGLGPQHRTTQVAAARLVSFYESCNRSADADRFRASLAEAP